MLVSFVVARIEYLISVILYQQMCIWISTVFFFPLGYIMALGRASCLKCADLSHLWVCHCHSAQHQQMKLPLLVESLFPLKKA